MDSNVTTYIDKEKAHAFLSHQSAPIAATAAKAELNSAANVIENSENPQQSTEKFREGDDVTYIDYNEELNSCKISK